MAYRSIFGVTTAYDLEFAQFQLTTGLLGDELWIAWDAHRMGKQVLYTKRVSRPAPPPPRMVDKDVSDQIRRLRAIAEQSPFPHERAAAAAKAEELIRKYVL